MFGVLPEIWKGSFCIDMDIRMLLVSLYSVCPCSLTVSCMHCECLSPRRTLATMNLPSFDFLYMPVNTFVSLGFAVIAMPPIHNHSHCTVTCASIQSCPFTVMSQHLLTCSLNTLTWMATTCGVRFPSSGAPCRTYSLLIFPPTTSMAVFPAVGATGHR